MDSDPAVRELVDITLRLEELRIEADRLERRRSELVLAVRELAVAREEAERMRRSALEDTGSRRLVPDWVHSQPPIAREDDRTRRLLGRPTALSQPVECPGAPRCTISFAHQHTADGQIL